MPGWSAEYMGSGDTGCEESPKCTSCPLPACKYDDAVAWNAFNRNKAWRTVISNAQKMGMTPREIAAEQGVYVRTVYRALERAPRAQPPIAKIQSQHRPVADGVPVYRLGACRHCRGDLGRYVNNNDSEWRCIQCGRPGTAAPPVEVADVAHN
jgi:hypothetical protein